MNCKKCGNVLNPTDVICPSCGEPVNPPAPLTSSVPDNTTMEAVATPMASTDIAVNPNVVLEDLVKDAPAPVSAVGQVASNEPVATPMASTDIAVNPNIVVENAQVPTPDIASVTMPEAGVNTLEQNVAPTQTAPVMDPNQAVTPAPVMPESQAQVQTPVDASAVNQPAPAVASPTQVQAPTDTSAVNQVAPATNPKKKLDIKFIIIVAVLLILIIGIAVFIIKML